MATARSNLGLYMEMSSHSLVKVARGDWEVVPDVIERMFRTRALYWP